MNLLPQGSGYRPRVACEIAPEGVVAARSEDAAGPLLAVARVPLSRGAVIPGLKPGNILDRVEAIAALRKALEAVGARPNTRGADVTLVIPDAAARVLLLDFDALPAKLTDALSLVRFRLKKLLPFDADDAMVSYQAMSSSRGLVRVLAVAMPRDVLAEYETAMREAGFEPGAVLPSTLACLPAVQEEQPVLLMNGNRLGLTMAILRGGTLLLHRSVDLQTTAGSGETIAGSGAVLPTAGLRPLPVVDREATAGEWAAQQPLPEHGRNSYEDRIRDEMAVQSVDGLTGLPSPQVFGDVADGAASAQNGHGDYPILLAAGSLRDMAGAEDVLASLAASALSEGGSRALPVADPRTEEEIAQALSVAVAYFEDTLSMPPAQLLSAGSLTAQALTALLQREGLADIEGLRVRELVESAVLAADAVSAAVPRGTLAGVLGALRG